MANPHGFAKDAPVPTPSLSPDSPLPANVETTPSGVTMRMVWLPQSATNRLPTSSTAMPHGWAKLASDAEPFCDPRWPEPAWTLSLPSSSTQMRCWPVSLTYRREPNMASPHGLSRLSWSARNGEHGAMNSSTKTELPATL
eukprot:scaffold91744_cov78-Phaeocystis_antarctica.AAC.1